MFGYSLDDSDKPVFLIWPERTESNGFWLLDVETGHYHNLCQAPSIRAKRRLRSSSQTTSTVNAEDVDSDLEELADHYYSPLRRYSTTSERGRPRRYTTQELFAQEWDFQGGRDGLERFLSLPATWPLARLMFPIRNLKKQMETLLQTYCFETAVTCAEVEEQSSFIKRMAIHQYMAIYLAETITGLLQRVLTHPAKGLVNETNAALLTQKFWVQAIYTELLCASSRFRAVREKTAEATQWVGKGCLPPF